LASNHVGVWGRGAAGEEGKEGKVGKVGAGGERERHGDREGEAMFRR